MENCPKFIKFIQNFPESPLNSPYDVQESKQEVTKVVLSQKLLCLTR